MSRFATMLNPKRTEMRNGLCKERFSSARASMQLRRFKPGLSHPQPGLNEVISGIQGPSWLRPGLNFFPHLDAQRGPNRQLAGVLARDHADPAAP